MRVRLAVRRNKAIVSICGFGEYSMKRNVSPASVARILSLAMKYSNTLVVGKNVFEFSC